MQESTVLLQSPDDGSALRRNGQMLESTGVSTLSYPIQEEVPILLPVRKLPGEAGNVAHYQKDAEIFDYFEPPADGATRHENRRVHETILSQVPQNAEVILDIGCGSAWVAEALCPGGKEVWSLDVSTVNPIQAVRRFPFPRHRGIVADVMALPFRDGVFDVVIASEVLEHLPSPTGFFRSAMRVIKPGGLLILTTPYKEVIQYSLCIHCNQPTPHHAHLHSFDEHNILHIKHNSNSRAIKVKPFSNKALAKLQTHSLMGILPYPWWALVDNLANKLIGRQGRLLAVFQQGLPS